MRSFGGLLLLAVIWGLSIPATKLGLESLPPLTLTALRFAFAIPLLLPFALGRHRPPWREMPRIAALGLLGVGFGQVAQSYGVVGTSASVATIITATIPIFVVIFAALRLRQAVSGLQKLGLLAAFFGIALVAMDGQSADAFQSSIVGAAWLLASAVAIGFYYVWSVELAHRYGTGALAAWSTFFGFIALVPWAWWEASHTPFSPTATGIASALYLGAGVTALGILLWLNILRRVPASMAAAVQYLQPVIGIMASAAIFGDRLGLRFGLGVGFVLAGLAITISFQKPTSADPS